jgi:hypothetical protein
MVAICGRVARAGRLSERHPFHEDLRKILSALLVGFVGCVEFAHKTSFSRLRLLLAWLAPDTRGSHMRIVIRRTLTTSGMWVVRAAMIGLGRLGPAVKELLGGDPYAKYHVASDGLPSDFAKDLTRAVGMRLDKV